MIPNRIQHTTHEIKLDFIREQVNKWKHTIVHWPTANKAAYILIKVIKSNQSSKLRKKLGVVSFVDYVN